MERALASSGKPLVRWSNFLQKAKKELHGKEWPEYSQSRLTLLLHPNTSTVNYQKVLAPHPLQCYVHPQGS